jgi:phage gpG-like protein
MNIRVNINSAAVVNRIKAKISALNDKDRMLRSVATGMLPVIKTRIHEDGKAADDAPIGTYSPGYMKLRTGNYTSDKITRGKNKGNPRTKYNRTSDTKVVASLTRQMENDTSVLATDTGYAIGFNNIENRRKAGYVEATYKKKIWKLTDTERKLTKEIAIEYFNNVTE